MIHFVTLARLQDEFDLYRAMKKTVPGLGQAYH
jgi:hypothetical protein